MYPHQQIMNQTFTTMKKLIIIIIVALAALAHDNSYRTMSEGEKWAAFEDCSRPFGDSRCERCYQKIFGHPSTGHYYSGHY